MTIKTMLDDAAAFATADRQIDLPSVLDRASQAQARRTLTRRRSALAGLAVAAVIALIAVLLPLPSMFRGTVLPARRPAPVPSVTGVPSAWYSAPEWTPPVTRRRMTAAVMVLSVPLVTGRGPVLVSADAKTYASLPSWGPHDGGVALSSDGRKVAWWTTSSSKGRPSTVVHVLTLATGVQADTSLAGAKPQTMFWFKGGLHLTGEQYPAASGAVQSPGYHITWAIPVDKIASGQASPKGRHPLPAGAVTSMVQPDQDIATPGPLLDPSGERSAWTEQVSSGQWSVMVLPQAGPSLQRGNLRPISSEEPITLAKVLAWGPGGIVLQVNTSKSLGYPVHRSIRIMNPESGATQVVSRPHDTSVAIPVAIAGGLITSAAPIPASPPAFALDDRSHVAFMVGLVWSWYGGRIKAGLAAVLVLIAGLAVYRRRRAPAPG